MPMKCAIMQPNYMPWSGYFNLILESDVFVFYDDVQFEKGSWQNRNRILLNGKAHWITVPAHRNELKQLIKDIRIEDGTHWREKQVRVLEQTYSKHPHSKGLTEILDILSNITLTHLVDFDIKIIQAISKQLGIKPNFIRSSSLNIKGNRSERLIRICEHFHCDLYISPIGSKGYLEKDGNFESSTIKHTFQTFNPGPYPQYHNSDFVNQLSILDVVANLGWAQTFEYIKSGKIQHIGEANS